MDKLRTKTYIKEDLVVVHADDQQQVVDDQVNVVVHSHYWVAQGKSGGEQHTGRKKRHKNSG